MITLTNSILLYDEQKALSYFIYKELKERGFPLVHSFASSSDLLPRIHEDHKLLIMNGAGVTEEPSLITKLIRNKFPHLYIIVLNSSNCFTIKQLFLKNGANSTISFCWEYNDFIDTLETELKKFVAPIRNRKIDHNFPDKEISKYLQVLNINPNYLVILKLDAQGMSNKEIATASGLAYGNVITLKKRLKEKLSHNGSFKGITHRAKDLNLI